MWQQILKKDMSYCVCSGPNKTKGFTCKAHCRSKEIKKDVFSHTTFIDGPKPKSTIDFKKLENLAIKIIDTKIRQIKDIPKRYTGFITEYTKEVVLPRAKRMMEEDSNLTEKKAIKKAFNRKEFIRYALSKNVDSLLNR
tara:strand:+ start:446 stop:862 length:417 start_codon:yes stop_codon:yes gene_type:complete